MGSGLDETKAVDSALQGGRREQRTNDRVSAQLGERHSFGNLVWYSLLIPSQR